MATCPLCHSMRIVIVLSPHARAFCSRCGAKWIQEGVGQRAVHARESSPPNIASVSTHPSLPLVEVPNREAR